MITIKEGKRKNERDVWLHYIFMGRLRFNGSGILIYESYSNYMRVDFLHKLSTALMSYPIAELQKLRDSQ